MQITKILPNLNTKIQNKEFQKSHRQINNRVYQVDTTKSFYSIKNISFGKAYVQGTTIPDIEPEEYLAMREPAKKRLRRRYNDYFTNTTLNKDGLVDKKYQYLPLRDEKTMDKFIEISSVYSKYKENPIICLGRSPKWFLNTSLWMKDGIEDYKFVAFSGFWHRPDPVEGLVRMDRFAPKPEEIKEYRKYLKSIKADPKTIVDHMKETGKETIITDYIHSSKGACSFLEVMGEYAKDLGILEEFSKSIKIVGIGSREYMEEMNPYAESISDPRVVIPKVLWPYEKNIKQEYHNMDYRVFSEILLNQNANECRSTYYPSQAWTIYKPDKFKTGLIKDLNKVKEVVKLLPYDKSLTSFSPIMRDYRNLLNFRILDSLDARKLLKTTFKSKV